eukprot:3777042-Alexandrium_andersonii.AAC.1
MPMTMMSSCQLQTVCRHALILTLAPRAFLISAVMQQCGRSGLTLFVLRVASQGLSPLPLVARSCLLPRWAARLLLRPMPHGCVKTGRVGFGVAVRRLAASGALPSARAPCIVFVTTPSTQSVAGG